MRPLMLRKTREKKGAGSLGSLLRALLLGAALVCSGCSGMSSGTNPGAGPTDTHALEQEWGVRPESLRLTAAGYMLDFRYRVVAPDKARRFLSDRRARTYLINQASGTILAVPNPPKVGPLRQSTREPQADRIYYAMFANPGRQVAQGDLVTVVMGGFRAENLLVE